ncbi:MAG: hypothetical protein HYV32_06595 [Candidatus Kerfeldbacteria bacterium]|nr:hypothetical protein [Candidatus Kerfeldbacteria bacterium]
MSDKRTMHITAEDGAVMLFALLIVAMMMTIGFALASIIYREVSTARLFSDSLKSYYAAESGLEYELHVVSTQRKQDRDIADVLDMLSSTPERTLSQGGATFAMDETITQRTVSSIDSPVQMNRSLEIDLYDPDDPFQTILAQSVRFQWNENACPDTGQSRIEVTFDAFDEYTLGTSNDVINTQMLNCDSAVGNPYQCGSVSNWPDETKNYVIRVKPLDCDLAAMHVEFYRDNDGGGEVIDIPSVITVGVRGTSNTSQRVMTAQMKWVPSALDLVDFVLFSIDPIDKTE